MVEARQRESERRVTGWDSVAFNLRKDYFELVRYLGGSCLELNYSNFLSRQSPGLILCKVLIPSSRFPRESTSMKYNDVVMFLAGREHEKTAAKPLLHW